MSNNNQNLTEETPQKVVEKATAEPRVVPKSFIDHFSIFIGRLAMVLLPVIIAVMFYEVIMRYFFSRPTLWANELSLWLAGMVYLFAGVYAMQQRAHISIFILYDVVPRWLQRVFDFIAMACVVLFAYAVVLGAYKTSWKAFLNWDTFGTAWNPPIPATMKPLVLIACVLVAIQAINNFVMDSRLPKAEKYDPSAELDVDDVAEQLGQVEQIKRAESSGS